MLHSRSWARKPRRCGPYRCRQSAAAIPLATIQNVLRSIEYVYRGICAEAGNQQYTLAHRRLVLTFSLHGAAERPQDLPNAQLAHLSRQHDALEQPAVKPVELNDRGRNACEDQSCVRLIGVVPVLRNSSKVMAALISSAVVSAAPPRLDRLAVVTYFPILAAPLVGRALQLAH